MVHANRIVIVGAGDHGRGTLEIIRARNQQSREFDVVGFVDDDPSKQGRELGGVQVLGGLEWLNTNHAPQWGYLLALADCRAKRTVASRLRHLSPTYVNAIHPSAMVHADVQLGRDVIINAGAIAAFDTVIEDHVTINLNATLGHDCVVGAFSTIAPGANIAGRVQIGEGCDVGLNATVAKGITVGAWSFIGPGTVVLKDLASASRVFGNPARAVLP